MKNLSPEDLESLDLDTYKCHKVVRAARILKVPAHGRLLLGGRFPQAGRPEELEVGTAWADRFSPSFAESMTVEFFRSNAANVEEFFVINVGGTSVKLAPTRQDVLDLTRIMNEDT